MRINLFARALSLLVLVSLCLSLFACGDEPTEREIDYCEISLDLPVEYTELDSGDAFDKAYSSGGRVVGITRLSFDACIAEGVLITMDARGFCRYYTELLGIGYPEVSELGDTVYYTYLDEDEGGEVTFRMPQFVVTPYSYIVITYLASESAMAGAEEQFLGIASSVHLSGKF